MDTRGMSSDDVCRSSGIPYKQFFDYISGNVEPSASDVVGVAKALNVSSDYLLGLKAEPGMLARKSMVLCFQLSMQECGSWNGRWSRKDDVFVITKTRRDVSEAIMRELDGKKFSYRWPDGWTACVSCRVVDSKEAASLRRKSHGFCGYDWMVRSILAERRISPAYAAK